MPNRPLYAYYGDDFTGSTDVLEQLAGAGAAAVLFLGPPSLEHLARFEGVQAIGIAGDSRSRSPEWMSERLPPIFEGLKSLGAPVTHYKVCSTFDSSPDRGSIGRAMEIGNAVFEPPLLPVVVGAPHLRRYVSFGNLFAAAGGDEVFRIDRHPTMSRHPATPMHEADLRRHLAAQTDLQIGLIDLPTLQGGRATEALMRRLESGADAVLFDGIDEATLAQVGGLIWSYAKSRPVFGVGSSGLTHSLISQWRAEGLIEAGPLSTAPEPVDAFLVVSGSCSPVTARQIDWALANGYHGVLAAPERLLDRQGGTAARAACIEEAVGVLRRVGKALVYSAAGPLPAGAVVEGDTLGAAMGEMLKAIVERSGVRRVLVAGGDTSSHAVAQLGVHALTYVGPTQVGAPLCRAHADSSVFDGLELVLKGGQMGTADFFEVVRGGS